MLARDADGEVPRRILERRAARTAELGHGEVYERHRCTLDWLAVQPLLLYETVRAHQNTQRRWLIELA